MEVNLSAPKTVTENHRQKIIGWIRCNRHGSAARRLLA